MTKRLIDEIEDCMNAMQREPERWCDHDALRWIARVFMSTRSRTERLRLIWEIIRP